MIRWRHPRCEPRPEHGWLSLDEPVRRAIWAMPDRLWHTALEQVRTLRDSAEVAELTRLVDLDGYLADTGFGLAGPHHSSALRGRRPLDMAVVAGDPASGRRTADSVSGVLF